VACRDRLGEHLAQQLARGLLQALGAQNDGLARGQMRGEGAGDTPHVLGGRHHQHHVLRG
jgi:hypothetical protein